MVARVDGVKHSRGQQSVVVIINVGGADTAAMPASREAGTARAGHNRPRRDGKISGWAPIQKYGSVSGSPFIER